MQMIDNDLNFGLSDSEVEIRIQKGQINVNTNPATKSIKKIFFDNVFTLFNGINLLLAILVISVQSYRNVLFMGVVFSNLAIGIFQEIRAKKTIDKLSLINSPHVTLVRNKRKIALSIENIVLDDVMFLSSSEQICSDSMVLSGEIEVNESLLTGESDLVIKRARDTLLSGSFVVSGNCYAKVINVGADNYAAKITSEAKKAKKVQSNLMKSLNLIVKIVSIFIIPIGALLFCRQFYIIGSPLQDAVINTVAALIGMIPEGLILLTSIALAVGVIKLASLKTLVQELYSIETLARVDTLCLDKTGTITEGIMQVHDVVAFEGVEIGNVHDALEALVHSLNDNNATFIALKAYFNNDSKWKCVSSVAFSSQRKWSGASFDNGESYIIGAAEFIIQHSDDKIKKRLEKYAQIGHRVLLVAKSLEKLENNELPKSVIAIGCILLVDKIRNEASDTLNFFAQQGVNIKVISGDNPITVAEVARRAGLQNADKYIDVSTLTTNEQLEKAAVTYTVFGRVTPEQKKLLVISLKKAGRTVAMTGDGVNDVLALKEADCSIAMAAGSDAARNVSQLVLLDSNFASLPHGVMEGRRVINNIERAASLFLVKTIFSFILSAIFSFINNPYPFEPIQLTLISTLTIGIPSFFLAIEPNRNRVEGKFIVNVMKKALPSAIIVVLGVMAITFIGLPSVLTSSLCALFTGVVGLCTLWRVSRPLNILRKIIFALMTVCFFGAIILFGELFMFIF